MLMKENNFLPVRIIYAFRERFVEKDFVFPFLTAVIGVVQHETVLSTVNSTTDVMI